MLNEKLRFMLAPNDGGEGDGAGKVGGGTAGGGDGGEDDGGSRGGSGLLKAARDGGEGDGDKSGLDKTPAPKDGEFDLALLPEQFRDDDPAKALEKVFGAWKGMRDKLAKGGEVPEKPDGYEVKIPSGKEKFFPDAEKDAGMKVFREAAHAAGLSQEGFDKLTQSLVDGMAREKMLVEPMDFEAERNKLDPDPEKALQRVQAADAWISALAAGTDGAGNPKLSPEMKMEAEMLLESAGGVELVEYFMGMKTSGPSLGNEEPGGGYSAEDWERDRRDDRYGKDDKFTRRVDEMGKQLFNG